MKGPMNGILNGGPAMEPFLMMYATRIIVSRAVLAPHQGVATHADRRQRCRVERSRHIAMSASRGESWVLRPVSWKGLCATSAIPRAGRPWHWLVQKPCRRLGWSE